ncbi:MAG: hypothetical protein QNJ70_25275 [Xenococcaceae cyanobacterium MO_207.B15]|nr:hypothetical protein [Xenococcaceae cyanobacterium MO_207.B15]
MSSLKAKIIQQLDYLPHNALKQVLDFVEFLNWRKMENSQAKSTLIGEDLDKEQDRAWLETDLSNLSEYEPYEWDLGELEEGLPIEIDSQKGIVVVEE